MGWLKKYQDGGTIAISPKSYVTNDGLFKDLKPYTMMTDDLLLKQTFVESSFKPKTSGAGAQGYTQFTPITIKELKRRKIVDDSFDINNPEHAVNAQRAYMDVLYNSDFIDKDNQTEEVRMAKTLAAYNMGPGGLKKLLTREKKAGNNIYTSLDWTQQLPTETRNYIDMIMFDKNTKGRPKVQENFLKAIEDPKNENIVSQYAASYQDGGIIEDDRGQWAHPGKITKINSNNITMNGVNYPVMGISDTGDTKIMKPGQNYFFEGNSVTEIPLAKHGKWMDKYNK